MIEVLKKGVIITIVTLLLILIGCLPKKEDSKEVLLKKNDSVYFYLNESKKGNLEEYERLKLLKKSYELAGDKKDSISVIDFLNIAKAAYKFEDTIFFKKVNNEAYKNILSLKDTALIAKSHWNYGLYYAKKGVFDSSYYHFYNSNKMYKQVKDETKISATYFNMAFVLGRLKEYSESENYLFKAIKIAKKNNDHKKLYECYNLLGNLSKGLKEYDKAISFFNTASSHVEKIKNKKVYYEGILNNLGLIYKKKGKYKKSISYYNKALKNKKLKLSYVSNYARIKDNLAHTRLLSGDTTNVKQEMLEALKIRDSIQNFAGIVINNLHLSDYYLTAKDTLKAISYAKEANKLAIEKTVNRDILASSLLLSKIDLKNTADHFENYVNLRDSLELKERRLRNKFARIRFETDEYIEEANRLSAQQTIILISSIALITVLSLLYFVRLQRSKNKALQLETAQQQANQEVYQLLLKQQANLEEGRMKERHRISEELHDGVLGRIFGTRMGLGFLDIQAEESTKKQHEKYVDELQSIEKEIRVISHELKNELIDKADYIQIIEQLLQEQCKISGFVFTLESSNELYWNSIDDEIKIHSYRILQEAIQNINKYAQATEVKIIFDVDKGKLLMHIEDNGVGFNVERKNKGIGLENIASRIKKLGGIFKLNSIVKKGTILYIEIPLQKVNIL